MKSEFTCSRSQVEVYKVRVNGEFADISIDDNGEAGRVQIASSYGSWQNFWGSCGESFKAFLIGLDRQYLARKVGEDDWFDHDATIAQLKMHVKDYADGDKAIKRKIAEELATLSDSVNRSEFAVAVSHCPEIMKMEEFCPHMQTDTSPTFKKFWEVIWVPFCAELKKELQPLPQIEKEEAVDVKWKLVGHSYQIADTGDYDGHYEVTDGKISLLTKDDDEEELTAIVDALNKSGCEFYQDDWLEFENEILKEELSELKTNKTPEDGQL